MPLVGVWLCWSGGRRIPKVRLPWGKAGCFNMLYVLTSDQRYTIRGAEQDSVHIRVPRQQPVKGLLHGRVLEQNGVQQDVRRLCWECRGGTGPKRHGHTGPIDASRAYHGVHCFSPSSTSRSAPSCSARARACKGKRDWGRGV